jgi:PAS domain S-box-containing protein
MSGSIMNEEIIELDAGKYIVSKTDDKGIITYGNDYFVEISGYTESELIGQPHNIIRHPDMPRAIFQILWERLKNGENMIAVVKNLSKDGKAYWVTTEFETKRDKLTNEIIGYTAFRKAATYKAVNEMTPLYKTLRDIENKFNVEDSLKYLTGYLEDKHKSYDEYMDDVIENRGIFKIFFKAMKKIFG